MKLREFIKYLSNFREDFMDKEVMVECKNGLLTPAVVKLNRKDHYVFDGDESIIENLVVTSN